MITTGNYVIGGASTGLGRYIMKEAGSASGAAMIYCVAHDSDEERHRQFASAVAQRRLPVVIISSWEVYPRGIDEVIYENSRISPDTEYGRICASAERIIGEAAHKAGMPCMVLRPAMTFGTDVKGEAESMFREVMAGRWFGIRRHSVPRSAVCAIDVARVALSLAGRDGVCNVSDGRTPDLLEIANAMSANSGYDKRQYVLPLTAARILARIADVCPFICRGWRSQALADKITPRTLDTAALREALPDYKFFNTVGVISRTDPDYPYQTL